MEGKLGVHGPSDAVGDCPVFGQDATYMMMGDEDAS